MTVIMGAILAGLITTSREGIKTTIKHCWYGIKSNQRITPRKGNSKSSSCEPQTLTQAWTNDCGNL